MLSTCIRQWLSIYSLLFISLFLGSCGQSSNNQRNPTLTEQDKQAIERRSEVAPYAVIARVPRNKLETKDVSAVEFVYIKDKMNLTSSTEVAQAFSKGTPFEVSDKVPTQEDFNLCGGCGGGSGWGFVGGVFNWLGNLVGSVFDIAVGAVQFTVGSIVNLGRALFNFTPVYYDNGYGYGYGCGEQHFYEDYSYYTYQGGCQNPCGQNPCNQNPCSQNPCGQNPCGQNPCNQNPCGQNPCNQNPCGQNPCNQNPCGQNPCGQIPGGGGTPGWEFPF